MSATEAFGLALALAVFVYLLLRAVPRGEPVSAISIGQIVFYAVALVALGMPLGLFMARVYSAEGGVFTRRFGLGALERGFYRIVRADPAREQDWKSYAKSVVIFSAVFSLVLYALLRLQSHLFLNPDGLPGGAVAHLAEHDGELRDEHQLAVLRRRVHDVVPEPDGRARGAELRLGRRRHGRPRGRHPRLHAPLVEDAGELLAGPLPVARLHPPPALGRARDRAHLAGRAADLRRRRDRDDARGRRAVDRARPGRVADRDQAAGDERRRLLQLELGRPVREPERAHELPRDALDPADPGRPRLHVREAGRGAEAGLRGLRGHVRHVRRSAWR